MKYCLIFSREIFYVTIVLCLNILWLKAINEITARQTWSSLCKHDIIKVCSIEYLTTRISVANFLSTPEPFTKLQNIQRWGYCLAFVVSITVQQLTFLPILYI